MSYSSSGRVTAFRKTLGFFPRKSRFAGFFFRNHQMAVVTYFAARNFFGFLTFAGRGWRVSRNPSENPDMYIQMWLVRKETASNTMIRHTHIHVYAQFTTFMHLQGHCRTIPRSSKFSCVRFHFGLNVVSQQASYEPMLWLITTKLLYE